MCRAMEADWTLGGNYARTFLKSATAVASVTKEMVDDVERGHREVETVTKNRVDNARGQG